MKSTRISDLYDEEMAVDPMVDFLRSLNIKITVARLHIATALKLAEQPLSIYQLQQKIPDISSSSIYRTLESLIEHGGVRAVHIGGTDISYELILPAHHHHHIICTDCRDIEDVDVCIEGKTEDHVLTHSTKFAKLSRHSLEFFGLCKQCAKK